MVWTREVIGCAILGGTIAVKGAGRLRRMAAGLVALELGVASARVALRIPVGAAMSAPVVAGLPPLSCGIDGGLVLLGLVAVLTDVVHLWRQAARGPAVLAMLGGGLVAWAGLPLVASGVNPALAVTAAGAGLLGWALLRTGQAGFRGRLAGVLGRASPRNGAEAGSRTVSWWVALGAVLAMVLIPDGQVVLVAGMVMAVAAHLAARRAGRVGVLPLLPIVLVPVLLVEAHYLRVIAGPVGLGTGTLADVPISPAAAAMLAPPFLIAAFVAASPVLLRRWLPAGLTALGGIALMVRLVHPLFGDALAGWETLFVPLGIVMLWCSALSDDWRGFAGMAAWTVALVVEPGGAVAAWLLALTAALVVLPWPLYPVRLAGGLAAGAGLSLGLPALLMHQVTYALLAALALVMLVAGRSHRPGMVYSGDSHETNAQSGADDAIHTASPSL